jgi:hypothetical protein
MRQRRRDVTAAIRSVTEGAMKKMVEPVALPAPEKMAGLTLALAAALAEGAIEENEQPAKSPAVSAPRGRSAYGDAEEQDARVTPDSPGEARLDEDRARRGRRRAPAGHVGEPGSGAHQPGQFPADMTRDKAVNAYMAALRALRRAQRGQVISESAAAAARAEADDAASTVATAQQALLMARLTLDATLMAER